MKLRPMGAESFHAERQTDMMKLTVAFHNFANATKNSVARKLSIFVHPQEKEGSCVIMGNPQKRVHVNSCHINPYRTNVENRVSS